MVINPNDEVYFLDTRGLVIDYQVADWLIKQKYLPVEKIKAHIKPAAKIISNNLNPKDPDTQKIFSASAMAVHGKTIVYIYVILAA